MSNLWISIMHPEWLTSVSPCLLAFLLPPHIGPVLFWQTISLKITQALYSWADWYSQEFCWHIHMHINYILYKQIHLHTYICVCIYIYYKAQSFIFCSDELSFHPVFRCYVPLNSLLFSHCNSKLFFSNMICPVKWRTHWLWSSNSRTRIQSPLCRLGAERL